MDVSAPTVHTLAGDPAATTPKDRKTLRQLRSIRDHVEVRMRTRPQRESEDLGGNRGMGCEAKRSSQTRPLLEMWEAGTLQRERAS